MVRGINQSFEIWKKFMETMMFDWKRQPLLRDEKGEYIKNPDGSYKQGPDQYTKVQGSLRPIQLFEYVVPQESLQEVLAMQNLHKTYDQLRPEVKPIAWTLRKLLGAKKIPDMPDLKAKESWQVTNKFVPMDTVAGGTAVYVIGMKNDITQDFIFDMGHGRTEGWHQEGL